MHLSYPVGDLALFFATTVIALRHRQYETERPVVALLFAAIVCLVVGNTWNAVLLLNAPAYQSGGPPDLFWMAFYALLPLAGLVRVRLTQFTLAGEHAAPVSRKPGDLRRHDLVAGLRVTAPVAAALLASAVLFIRSELVETGVYPRAAPLISLGLLGLALVRQGLTAADNERLRREREDALRESAAQMETFLGVAGHELKTPLTGNLLGLQLVEGRIRRLLQREPVDAEVASLLEPVERAERQEQRMDRLVDDLLDVARVRAGKLDLRPAPTDLAAIVREAVEVQRQLNPERAILLEGPDDRRVPVTGDAHRVGQVVTNYLTNALKYSSADRTVAVGLETDGGQARVWVRDGGPGLPPDEHERILERFHRAPGIAVQSGGGIGLGLGLHVSRTIIE